MITNFPYTTPWTLTDLSIWVCWNRLFSRLPSISALRAAHSGLSSNTGMFRLKLLISFLSLSIVGSIDWHISGGVRRINNPYVEARRISSSIERTLQTCSCASAQDKIFMSTHVLARSVGPHNLHGGSQQQRHPYDRCRWNWRHAFLHESDK